ncbi:MAG: ABC transporter substrate-binding protein [Alphaproteobacteria bacterium]|nr:ABC transporter substrate-binding protein [Alphaproteobacteria bacterium]
MMNMLTLLEHGQMKKKNYRLITLSLFTIFFLNNAFANPQISIKDYISIGETPKYTEGFKHLDYTNPDAPKKGHITLPAYGTFDNFNPYIFKGTASIETVNLTLDSLGITPADDPETAYPLIAEKFELPSDKSFIGFFINPKARFSNGEPVTADDVIFSFNSLINKGSPIYKFYYADVDYVKKISKNHVRFYFKTDTQNRELPLILTSLKIFSAKDFTNKEYDKPVLIPPLGSGPYIVKDFEAGRYIIFKRNPNYWAKDLPTRKGIFNFDEVKYDYYQDTTVTLQALFAGNIDIRTEYIAKSWATGYNNELVKNGKIKKQAIAHNRPATLQFFAFNTRKQKFQNPYVRQAISFAFNFPWANKNLFYNQYLLLNSFFANTRFSAKGIPQDKELQILTNLKDKLPPEILTTPIETIFRDDSLSDRENLKLAVKLLQKAGYDFINEKMCNVKTGEPLEFEIVINAANGNTFTRVLLPFIENLRKIGIKATTRILEVNTYKNKMDKFDFDIVIGGYHGTSMPGSEQKDLWSSSTADIEGSNNIIGVKNPIVDELVQKIISTADNEQYTAYVQALDRVLLFNHYVIFNWYTNSDRIAYWDKFAYPENNLDTGVDIFTWWMKD